MSSIIVIVPTIRQFCPMMHGIRSDVATDGLPHRQHCRQHKEFVVQQYSFGRFIRTKHSTYAESTSGTRIASRMWRIQFTQCNGIGDGGATSQGVRGDGLQSAAQAKRRGGKPDATQQISR
ncbi:MAG: hypothetical protein J0H71_21230 [Rhizobiales bacterium]|nr:hypothetical protein [Hyphomicrobiales bacterium]